MISQFHDIHSSLVQRVPSCGDSLACLAEQYRRHRELRARCLLYAASLLRNESPADERVDRVLTFHTKIAKRLTFFAEFQMPSELAHLYELYGRALVMAGDTNAGLAVWAKLLAVWPDHPGINELLRQLADGSPLMRDHDQR
jgi:hypothetical protein